jgi:hypothetical protein
MGRTRAVFSNRLRFAWDDEKVVPCASRITDVLNMTRLNCGSIHVMQPGPNRKHARAAQQNLPARTFADPGPAISTHSPGKARQNLRD